MESEENKIVSLQKRSHEALLRLLNNIGVIGASLAALADIIFVIIAVVGIHVEMQPFGIILYSVVNALIGVFISCLLRYQGVKYAEIENKELCDKYYNKKVKESKRHLPLQWWMTLKSLQDIVIKGCTTAFCLFGVTYITIQGSKNPIQILITFATLVLFACFGLIAMNGSYCRFYNIQVPIMKMKVEEREYVNVADSSNNPISNSSGDITVCNDGPKTKIVNDSLKAQEQVNIIIDTINKESIAEQTRKWCEEHCED